MGPWGHLSASAASSQSKPLTQHSFYGGHDVALQICELDVDVQSRHGSFGSLAAGGSDARRDSARGDEVKHREL